MVTNGATSFSFPSISALIYLLNIQKFDNINHTAVLVQNSSVRLRHIFPYLINVIALPLYAKERICKDIKGNRTIADLRYG